MSNEPGDGERASFYGALAPGWEFYRRAGARLTEEKHPALVRSGETAEDVQYEAWHRFDKAHLVMLAEQDIIPTDIAAANLQGLRRLEEEGLIEVRREMGHLAHGGEAYLIRELGEETAGWIHIGRSSVDLGAVGRRFLVRESVLAVMDAMLDAIDAHCETAREYLDAPMPMYTSARHSQVVTLAYYLMAWARPLERGIGRLEDAYRSINQSPAGAAAGTATDFPIDRERTADLLGFDAVADNAMDATRGDVDTIIDVVSELAAVTGNVATAADRLATWGGTEYGLIDMPDRYYSTSSILTHKTNPRALQRVQRSVRSTVATLMESYVGGYRARPSSDTFENVVSSLELWSEVLGTIEFDRGRGEEKVYSDWALAPDIAGQMVREEGINWRWAHQITAIAVRRANEDGKSVRDLTSADIDRAAEEYLGEPLGMSQDALEEVIDADRALEARSQVTGSPAPAQVARQIEASQATVETGRKTLQEFRTALEDADDRLERAVDDLIARANPD